MWTTQAHSSRSTHSPPHSHKPAHSTPTHTAQPAPDARYCGLAAAWVYCTGTVPRGSADAGTYSATRSDSSGYSTPDQETLQYMRLLLPSPLAVEAVSITEQLVVSCMDGSGDTAMRCMDVTQGVSGWTCGPCAEAAWARSSSRVLAMRA